MSYYMSRTQFPSLTKAAIVTLCPSAALLLTKCLVRQHPVSCPWLSLKKMTVLILHMRKCRAQNLDKVTYTGHAGTGARSLTPFLDS